MRSLDAIWPAETLCEAALEPLRRHRKLAKQAEASKDSQLVAATALGYRVVDDQWRRVSIADVQLDTETSIDESGRAGQRYQFDMSLNGTYQIYVSSSGVIHISQPNSDGARDQTVVTQAFVGCISSLQRLRGDLNPSERRTARSVTPIPYPSGFTTFGRFSHSECRETDCFNGFHSRGGKHVRLVKLRSISQWWSYDL